MTGQDRFDGAPFHLDAAARRWVDETLTGLGLEEKAALVFSATVFGPAMTPNSFGGLAPGFVGHIGAPSPAEERASLAALDAAFRVPVTLAADLEGSFATPPGGTPAPTPLALAAANDPALTERVAAAMAQEARQSGIGWSLTPALDLNVAFRSAITGTRSYGSDLGKVRAHAIATIRGIQGAGMAATAKHWPGEGYDDRDQHLATTLNPLSFAEWEERFGKLYRAAIEAGVMSVMAAHIAFPAYLREVEGIEGPEAYRPASINRRLNEGLLRGRLGFRGLITSDATAMAGLTGILPRDRLVVEVLAAGCDVILHSEDLRADTDHLLGALADGRLTEARLNEAVARQLAFKAALGLHRGRDPAPEVTEEDREAIALALVSAPTLVKDVDRILPMTPERYPRVYLVSRGVGFPPTTTTGALPLAFSDLLKEAGFGVVSHTWGTPLDPAGCDLMLFAYAEECLLTRGTITNDWGSMTGQFEAAMARPWHDIPSLMISFGWPYHLYEAPQVGAYVNVYMAHEAMQRTVLDALTGRRPFSGASPVDPFCGLPPGAFGVPG